MSHYLWPQQHCTLGSNGLGMLLLGLFKIFSGFSKMLYHMCLSMSSLYDSGHVVFLFLALDL